MILISHRGNLEGSIGSMENNPEYVDKAILMGYDVEVDVWYIDSKFFLGHDSPQYEVQLDWFIQRKNNLWLHSKNVESLIFFQKNSCDLNFFWHENDKVTMTSKSFIWAYPGTQPIENSIAVLPEVFNDELKSCIGICSDYIILYND